MLCYLDMSSLKDIKIAPLALVFLGIFSRLLPHPANFAPITAIALFAGVYLPKRYVLILPVTILFISDFFLGFYGFSMLYVYGSMLLISFIGLYLRNKNSKVNILIFTLFSSLLFFIVTNFGAWLELSMVYNYYTKDFAGLVNSYVAGIPFYRNTVLGDVFYSTIFFGGYELVRLFANRFVAKVKLQNIF